MDKLKYETYKEDLPGMTMDCPDTFARLAHILAEQVLELWKGKEKTWYAAYLMNDAVECMLVFEEATMIGHFEDGLEQMTSARLSIESERYVLSVKQGDHNSFTLFFKDLTMETHTYQYHKVAHVWVKGCEPLRQIVYRLGIVRDKVLFLGSEYSNELELELLPLLQFAPLRSWFSVPWDKDREFESTELGIETFQKICAEAGDEQLLPLVARYALNFQKRSGRKLAAKIQEALGDAKQEAVFQLMWKKICAASQQYEKRFFGEQEEALIQEQRLELEKQLLEDGYQGHYPEFRQDTGEEVAVCKILEEQPFTVGDKKTYRFYMFFSILEQKKVETDQIGSFSGFFKGKGRTGEIRMIEISLKK